MIDTPISPGDSNSGFASPLLTVADIIRFKADYEADVRLLDELPARIKAKKRKYEASLVFAPAGFDPDAPIAEKTTNLFSASQKVPQLIFEPILEARLMSGEEVAQEGKDSEEGGRRITWSGELEKILEKASEGISHQDALSMLKSTSLGGRVSKGDKGFYNAIALLEKKNRLIKNGGLLYSQKLVEEMKSRGEILPDVSTETRRRAGGSGNAVLEILRVHSSGLDANELRNELGKLPGITKSITKHGHYIYNVLGTLMGQGEIEKDAQGIYRIRKVM